jgi:signal transduction histidine kinase
MNEDVKRLLIRKNGNGLKSIQSRIQQLNATIDYQVNSDKQNHIRIKIPLHEIQH